MPTLVRSSLTDAPLDILKFAVSAFHKGCVALATLVDIRGGTARPLGSHVAVAADGRFCGFVSGGCVEAAVAAEALDAMAVGHDRLVNFGEGSPFFDIVLPCGGGITVAIHLLRDLKPLLQVIRDIDCRQPASTRYDPSLETLVIVDASERSSWKDGAFETVYRPSTRLIVSGQATESEALIRLAEVIGYDVVSVNDLGLPEAVSKIDPFSAVALLHHDLDAEMDILKAALTSKAFYVGALGSTRTHRRRIDRLRERGITQLAMDKIKAPIGIFGPTRDSNSLALSVLADVGAARLTFYS